MFKFDMKHTFEEREAESLRIRSKYPDRIPVIVEKSDKASSELLDIDKNKFLVPGDLSWSQFLWIIRKRIKLSSDKAIFVFANDKLPGSAMLMSQVYDEYKSPDSYLKVSYVDESTFGAENLVVNSVVTHFGKQKSVFVNFNEISSILHRDPKHLYSFILAQLGTSGTVDGNQLIIKGRYQSIHLNSVLNRYIKEFVTCNECDSQETNINKTHLTCDSCGSERSVLNIRKEHTARI